LDQQALNILIVDDDNFFVEIVASQLKEEFKYKTIVAHNGKEAQDLLLNGHNHFDIILTDYEMPEMTGLELLQWINQQKIEIPVVMLTAAGSELVAVEAMKTGAYDYVRKEHLDLQHLGIVITATYERRQFRIAKMLEEERIREIGLNALATDKVRDILNAIAPTLNNALANMNVELEIQGEEICGRLHSPYKEELQQLLQRIQKEALSVESSVRGLLGLYRMLYAHHAEVREIDRLKKEIESRQIPSKN